MQVKEIFVIRFISCLSVVLLHAISMVLMVRADMLGDTVFRVVESFRTLLMFSTPAFIFISEFLLAHAYPGGVPEGFLKKRFKTIFIPFLFIAVLDAFMTAGLMMQQFHASVILKNCWRIFSWGISSVISSSSFFNFTCCTCASIHFAKGVA